MRVCARTPRSPAVSGHSAGKLVLRHTRAPDPLHQATPALSGQKPSGASDTKHRNICEAPRRRSHKGYGGSKVRDLFPALYKIYNTIMDKLPSNILQLFRDSRIAAGCDLFNNSVSL
ncbi:unnamed protein product [Leptosia nina]|uniref:Uncharacterized protein n=1 Tax=Leptosia nina TaxID=320188 RepID=A0AAV1K0Y4_9NEOP